MDHKNERDLKNDIKSFYSDMVKRENIKDDYDLKLICEELRNIHDRYNMLLSYFENRREYMVGKDKPIKSLYFEIEQNRKYNVSRLNLNVYLDGEVIGNICDGWCDRLPDDILHALTEIF